MTDNLRARIAKAVADAQFAFDEGDPYNGPEDATVLADAVIEALGLGECDVQDCRCRHRYVTEWTADDN